MARGIPWRRAVPVGVVVVVVSAVAASAITSTGYRDRHTTENDASIWTAQANSNDPDNPGSFVGRANVLAGVIDTAVTAAPRPQLLQDGAHVLFHDAASGSVTSIDTNLGTTGAALVVPPLAAPPGTLAAGAAVTADDAGTPTVDLNAAGEVGLGADTVGILDQAAGRLYTFAADALPSGPLGAQHAAASVAKGSRLTVGTDGVVHVVAPNGAVDDYSAAGRHLRHTSLGVDLTKVTTPGSPFTVSAVGAQAVVLDGSGGVYVEGHTGSLGSAGDLGGGASGSGGPLLQEPGPARGSVLLETSGALAAMSLQTGAVTVLSTAGRGQPTAPVFVGERSCSYGAWAGSAAIPADASTTGSPAAGPVAVAVCDDGRRYAGAGEANPQWRVNHGSALLNDELTGKNLYFDEVTPLEIDDWSQAQRPSKGTQTATSTSTTVTTAPQQQPSSVDHPPKANDDDLATRPGTPLIAHVLANDTDPDGDVLAVTGLTNTPAASTGATVAVVDGGDAVQVTPPSGSLAPISFGYTIDDGRGLSSSARVTVAIHPLTQNAPPQVPPNEPPVTVAAGGHITVDLLRDATDPDGDPLTLGAAKLPTGAGSLEFTGAGLAVISPATPGAVPLSFGVSDGRGGLATGTQNLEVQPAGTQVPPQTNDDHLQVTAGVAGTVDVFANDVDGTGPGSASGTGATGTGATGTLTLTHVDSPAGLSVKQLGGGVLGVTAAAVGTTLVHYTASDGSASSSSVLRVDAVQPPAGQVVTAVRDDATLRPSTPTVVPVLANDLDSAGKVLVIDGLSDVPAGITVTQIDHAALSVSSQAPLTQPETFDYTASDGTASAVGTVVLRPAPGGVDQPPVTAPVTLDLRAGNAAPIDVLAHDFDPEGEALTLTSVTAPPAGQGALFVEAGQLRYVAPDVAIGSVTGSYVVKDSAGNASTGAVVIHVLPPNEPNHPPLPPDVTARVYAGRAVTVVVPLLGMDPDGDVTTLVGVSPSASGAAVLGQVGTLGADRFTFTAGGVGGTQDFSYQVRDSGGLINSATIRIGVVPPPAQNSPPVALPDTVSVAPGALRRVSVLANDSDPDGDPLRLDPAQLIQPSAGHVAIDGSFVDVTAPAKVPDGTKVSFGYGISDGRGGTAASTVTETVTAHPPLAPPIAVDDVAPAQRSGSLVKVNVLANDTIVNGTPAQATVAVPTTPGDPAVTPAAGGALSFTMPARAVSLPYTVTDAAGQTASAVLSVPLAAGQPPIASPDSASTRAGTPVTLPVTANDRDPQGLPLTVVKVPTVTGGSATVTGAGSVRFTPAAGFSGTGGFSYVVSDGGGTATGTATVTVTGGAPKPLTVTSLAVRVGAGASTTVDLSNAVADPNPADTLTFSGLRGATAGLKASLANGRLSITAAPTSTGVTTLTYVVTNGRSKGGTAGTVAVTVTAAAPKPGGSAKPGASSKPDAKPLPQALPDASSTLQGKPVTVPVLANDIDPFGKGLHIVSVSGGGDTGVATNGGQSLIFTPAAGFHGVAALSYVMADASGESSRQASGNVSITVIGRPDAPGLPTGTASSHQVMLSWPVPSANGGTISGYTVSWAGGTQACSGNSCLITGLTNGKDYTFTVTATDEAGAGPASTASQPIHVDQLPGVPDAPTASSGDRKISLTWPAPTTDGSAITSYTVVQSPGNAMQTVQSPAATFTGLSNGTAYTYKVDATNAAGTSDYSNSSAAATPAGVPATPAAPTGSVGSNGSQVTATWNAPDSNGSSITGYTLEVFENGGLKSTLKESDTSHLSDTVAATSGDSYTFAVSASNAVGTSAYSSQSSAVMASGVPDKVGTVVINYSCCKVMNVQWPAPASNGSAITHWVLDDNQGDTFTDNDATVDANEAVQFNVSYTFTVQACNAIGCGPFSDPSNTVKPDTGPSEPQVSYTTHMNSTTTWYVQYTFPTASQGSPVTSWTITEQASQTDGTDKTINATVTTDTYKSSTLHCDRVDDGGIPYDISDSINVTAHNAYPDTASAESDQVSPPC